MAGTIATRRRTKRTVIAALGLAGGLIAAGGLSGATSSAPGQGADRVHVATTGWSSERVKTVPITRRANDGQRVVMSLGPKRLGRLASGDRVEGMAELEVSTTCLERMPKCVGRIYHFSPYIKARLVLAGGPKAVRGRNVTPVSRSWSFRCSQQQPHRNHHCVLVIPSVERAIDDAAKLPCTGGRCHLNMVVSAHHSAAKRGHQLVIGVDDNHGISQNKGHLSAVRFPPQSTLARVARIVQRKPRRQRLPIGGDRPGAASRHVVVSRRIDNLRAGERLVVDARAVGGIKHLRYSTLIQSQLVLSRSPKSTKRAGPPRRIGSNAASFGMQNGFNCTRGRSGHSTPCDIRKVGVMRILRDARTRPLMNKGRRIPLYVNLVVGTRAVGVHGHRWRSGDRMRIQGGGIRIRRYGP